MPKAPVKTSRLLNAAHACSSTHHKIRKRERELRRRSPENRMGRYARVKQAILHRQVVLPPKLCPAIQRTEQEGPTQVLQACCPSEKSSHVLEKRSRIPADSAYSGRSTAQIWRSLSTKKTGKEMSQKGKQGPNIDSQQAEMLHSLYPDRGS